MVTSNTRLPERVNPILANTHLVSTLSWSCDFVPGPQPGKLIYSVTARQSLSLPIYLYNWPRKKKDER